MGSKEVTRAPRILSHDAPKPVAAPDHGPTDRAGSVRRNSSRVAGFRDRFEGEQAGGAGLGPMVVTGASGGGFDYDHGP